MKKASKKKTRRRQENDISIGPDEWLSFGKIKKGELTAAIDIDPILDPIIGFFENLELECNADCCGIDAFRFWPADIHTARAQLPEEKRGRLVLDLSQARGQIEALTGDVVYSRRFAQYFRKTVVLELFGHILNVLARNEHGG